MGEDYIVRATAADGAVRAFAITSKELVEEARLRHHTSATATAALGRLLSAGAMMGSMMKGEQDMLTILIRSCGPLEGMTVTADSHGNVKGYCVVPSADPPLKNGKLDVGGALGEGIMNVTRDLGMKEPYTGQIVLQTGEIAEDLTYYYAVSEQIPTSIGLGVLMNPNYTVRQAGGFIIQLMPDAGEEVITLLEEKLAHTASVTGMLECGLSPEDILDSFLGELGLVITDTLPAAFRCDCTREKVERAIRSLGEKDLSELVDLGKPVEARCDFCNTTYSFGVEEIKEILSSRRQS